MPVILTKPRHPDLHAADKLPRAVGKRRLVTVTDTVVRVLRDSGKALIVLYALAQPSRGKAPRKLANERDIPPFATQMYAHRAYGGATRSFVQDTYWLGVLEELTPSIYLAVAEELASPGERIGRKLARLVGLVENSPVLAAYGTCRSGKNPPPIEWDIWLHPSDPKDMELQRIVHGNLLATDKATQEIPEARLMVSQKVGGDTPETATDVHTGLSPKQWTNAYRRALRMAAKEGLVSESAAAAPIKIFLDVKSTYSTPAQIAAFMQATEALIVDVEGVGAFKHAQLDGLSVKRRMYLVSTPEEARTGWEAGRIPNNALVMFNGGCLLRPVGLIDWECDEKRLAFLEQLHRDAGSVYTTYTQEGVASVEALAKQAQIVNAYPWLFPYGIAYGNVNGKAERSIGDGSGMDEHDPFLDKSMIDPERAMFPAE